MFVTVDGTPQEIADLLFAVRNRQVKICSPKDTLEESMKSAFEVKIGSPNKDELTQDVQQAIDDTLEGERE
jgi:hypothetical protein